MPEPAKPVSVTVDFGGLATNIDPRDLTGGEAEDQVNMTCITTGELRMRGGVREVVFEEE